jgi:N-acetyl-anhydromuramyl-L-alanine amidase AmpD
MLSLQPLNTPPGPLPIIRRNYPADRNHYDLWRRGARIEYIVFHNTEGRDSRAYLSTTSRIVNGKDERVSIHKLVRHDGVYSIVEPAHTAWHCGETIPGYSNMNARSLGVEIESINSEGQCQEPYSESDYNFTAQTVAGWMFSYAIGWERVVRHADIASPPGRRHDPSGLDMARLQREVYAWLRFMQALPLRDHAKWII